MDLSFVFPCLNEEATLKACIERVNTSLSNDGGLACEIVVAQWVMADFSNLHLINLLLFLTHFISVPGLLAIGLLGIHGFKKSRSAP